MNDEEVEKYDNDERGGGDNTTVHQGKYSLFLKPLEKWTNIPTYIIIFFNPNFFIKL